MKIDITRPVEIADRTWWVGNYMEDDSFQCHVYLIEQGTQSVLIDPGSNLTFKYALEKIEKIIPFSYIKYFICHHQDPDITSSLPLIDQLIIRDDAVILSHWRGNALLKHYGLKKLPLVCVEKEGWNLSVEDRELKFIFTPYLHFPGAFVTYDEKTKTLFSSDLFGGFTNNWNLYAKDLSYFDDMQPFHEHYMPSKDILVHCLLKIEQLDISRIAPQHGSIIRSELVAPIISRLKSLDCGLFLMTQTSSDVEHLSKLNKILQDFLSKMIITRQLSEIVDNLIENLNSILDISDIEFYVELLDKTILLLDKKSINTGKIIDSPAWMKGILGLDRKNWYENNARAFKVINIPDKASDLHCAIMPLFSSESKRIFSVVSFQLADPEIIDDETSDLLKEIAGPFGIALEREVLLRSLEKEKQLFYERSIKDPLTDLYTRNYMQEAGERLCYLHSRDEKNLFGVAIFDIDDFKKINDEYGHITGDKVLIKSGEILNSEIRGGDIAVRYGGEEFLIFIINGSFQFFKQVSERIITRFAESDFCDELTGLQVTLSGGVAVHKKGESLNDVILRADKALYKSKNSGKNRMTIAEN